ncbi:hypothetical protein HW555_000521 [Spodoptera exigua]|uniref:Uncharacterized protein n=1 Tax=Spodoptera exigua TaxID=7107 RepID=A0A835GU93_SPOEX|nr:hypothetical protein HW555_000521 [Spodoptera exigua]
MQNHESDRDYGDFLGEDQGKDDTNTGPIPDCRRIFGLLNVPAEIIISSVAYTLMSFLLDVYTCTPYACKVLGSINTLVTVEYLATFRLVLSFAGLNHILCLEELERNRKEEKKEIYELPRGLKLIRRERKKCDLYAYSIMCLSVTAAGLSGSHGAERVVLMKSSHDRKEGGARRLSSAPPQETLREGSHRDKNELLNKKEQCGYDEK